MTKPIDKKKQFNTVNYHGIPLRFNPPLPTVKQLDKALALYRDGAPIKRVYSESGLGPFRLPHFLRRIKEPFRAPGGLKKPPAQYGVRTFTVNGKHCVEFERFIQIDGRSDRVRFWREYGEDAQTLLETVYREYCDPTIKVTDTAKRLQRAPHWVWYTAVALGAEPRVHGGYKPTHRGNKLTARRVWTGEN